MNSKNIKREYDNIFQKKVVTLAMKILPLNKIGELKK